MSRFYQARPEGLEEVRVYIEAMWQEYRPTGRDIPQSRTTALTHRRSPGARDATASPRRRP